MVWSVFLSQQCPAAALTSSEAIVPTALPGAWGAGSNERKQHNWLTGQDQLSTRKHTRYVCCPFTTAHDAPASEASCERAKGKVASGVFRLGCLDLPEVSQHLSSSLQPQQPICLSGTWENTMTPIWVIPRYSAKRWST